MIYDVVVVGAGPSGSTAAKTLAEHGIHVLLVDKEAFPRDKPCGGGLPIRTLTRFPYLKDLDAIASYSYGGCVYSPSLRYKVEITKADPVLAMIIRSTFDHALVKLCIEKGVDFQDKTLVTDINIQHDHVQLSLNNDMTISTSIVIGADGVHSTIARNMGSSFVARDKGMCILEEFLLKKDMIDSLYTQNHVCHIHPKFQGIQGYGWVFPKQHHVNVGIVTYDSMGHLKEQQMNLRSMFNHYLSFLKEQHLLPEHIQSIKMKGGILPVHPLTKTYFHRVLLCGDAAGFINPISGEGIHYAIVSGQLAGNVAAASIQQHNQTEQFLSKYETQWKHDFGKEIKVFLRSKDQWGKRGDTIVKLMNKDPQLAELIYLIFIGKESAYKMRWKLIKRVLYSLMIKR